MIKRNDSKPTIKQQKKIFLEKENETNKENNQTNKKKDVEIMKKEYYNVQKTKCSLIYNIFRYF